MTQILKGIIIYIAIIIICISCGCHYVYDYCNNEDYVCTEMLSTNPYRHPVDLDSYSDVVLFADGSLLKNAGYQDSELFSLKDICVADTICDIIFYDEDLRYRNFSHYNSDIDMPYDKFIVVITPAKCCKMDDFDNVTLEFGQNGPDSERLINAIYGDVNHLRQIFIVDSGDNSIKVYDHNGNFIARWTDIGNPYRVKIFNGYALILDNVNNCIKRYDLEGNYLDTPLDGPGFDNITAFLPIDDNEFWVADMGGERLMLISNRTASHEIHSEYCFWDVTFYIYKIIALDYESALRAVDREGNYILEFGGSFYY